MIEDLVQLIRENRNPCREPKHPQYIEGVFYLTQEQWDAILAAFPREPDHNYSQMVWGIPVQLIRDREPIKLPSGKLLYYSKLLESFYIVDPEVIPSYFKQEIK